MWESLQQLRLPDAWQQEAIRALAAGRDVIVQAPTGAGKTYIFEQYFQQAKLPRQAVYTVPTRALANDKYAEWRAKGWRVGITTGDRAVETGAPLLVATLEAQQDQRDAALFVIDEYQWLGDPLRGNHYEGVVMELPRATQLLLLSGSVANPNGVGDWLRKLGREVTVVEQKNRPVPLEEADLERSARALPDRVTGYWTRRLAAALREELGPVLVFAPHRKDAEKIARQAAGLPCVQPLRLSLEQERMAGPELAKLLKQRVAYHHSGLNYGQRAGLVEPLAKAGQLRIVVATLGLSAGINFSLRSVLVTATTFTSGGLPREVSPAELLQMFGRAGRRGLDEQGYVLMTENSPRLGQARAQNVRRAAPLPWRPLLRAFREPGDKLVAALNYQKRLFSSEPIALGIESTARIAEPLPCRLKTDTGRARLVRRENNPAPFCIECPHQPECKALSPAPTLIWLWNRLGLLDRELELTARGRLMSQFSGPEGLGVAAALEDEAYPLEDLVVDLANLAAGDRFCGQEARWGGRLAAACRKAYRRFTSEGFLEDGIPINYGTGGEIIVRLLRTKEFVPGNMLGEYANRGDVDRLWIEWTSLLRQIAGGESMEWPRWRELQALCRRELEMHGEDVLPDVPPLTAEQQKTVSHRLYF
jgi:superfamily II DNA/RNA helicase